MIIQPLIMIIQPGSTITLYSGVDIGTDMQLAFSTKAKQTAYFTSKIKKSYVNCTIVKDKIGSLKVAIKPVGQAGTGEITGVDLAESNYMSFINPSFDNKVIYCYIVDYRYLNNETAEIMYMIDYWQTWMFDDRAKAEKMREEDCARLDKTIDKLSDLTFTVKDNSDSIRELINQIDDREG